MTLDVKRDMPDLQRNTVHRVKVLFVLLSLNPLDSLLTAVYAVNSLNPTQHNLCNITEYSTLRTFPRLRKKRYILETEN